MTATPRVLVERKANPSELMSDDERIAPPSRPEITEINLIDVAVILWRRRVLMVWTLLLVMAVGVSVAVFKPETYAYSTVLELVSMWTSSNGSRVSPSAPWRINTCGRET